MPAIVAAYGNDIDLFIHALPHIAAEQPMIAATVKREPPRIAEAIGKNLLFLSRVAGKRISRRYGCRAQRAHIEPDNFPEQFCRVLAIADALGMPRAHIICIAAIADAYIEKTVRAEGKLAAVVVCLRMRHIKQHQLAVGISLIRISCRNKKLCYTGI